jgi:uncharacterized protein with HEPN domain
MTFPVPARLQVELEAARQGLLAVAAIVARGREAFDASIDHQRALAFCWVSTGSALKHYARRAGMSQGRGPLAPAIQFRDKLAHQPLDRLAPEVVWETSVHDATELLRVIEALINDLSR